MVKNIIIRSLLLYAELEACDMPINYVYVDNIQVVRTRNINNISTLIQHYVVQ